MKRLKWLAVILVMLVIGVNPKQEVKAEGVEDEGLGKVLEESKTYQEDKNKMEEKIDEKIKGLSEEEIMSMITYISEKEEKSEEDKLLYKKLSSRLDSIMIEDLWVMFKEMMKTFFILSITFVGVWFVVIKMIDYIEKIKGEIRDEMDRVY